MKLFNGPQGNMSYIEISGIETSTDHTDDYNPMVKRRTLNEN